MRTVFSYFCGAQTIFYLIVKKLTTQRVVVYVDYIYANFPYYVWKLRFKKINSFENQNNKPTTY